MLSFWCSHIYKMLHTSQGCFKFFKCFVNTFGKYSKRKVLKKKQSSKRWAIIFQSWNWMRDKLRFFCPVKVKYCFWTRTYCIRLWNKTHYCPILQREKKQVNKTRTHSMGVFCNFDINMRTDDFAWSCRSFQFQVYCAILATLHVISAQVCSFSYLASCHSGEQTDSWPELWCA